MPLCIRTINIYIHKCIDCVFKMEKDYYKCKKRLYKMIVSIKNRQSEGEKENKTQNWIDEQLMKQICKHTQETSWFDNYKLC